MVYTICCELVYSSRGAELHEYQLLLMMQTLREWIGASRPVPSTIAATWTKPKTKREPLLLAFTFNCVSKPKDKANMTSARRVYCQSLFSLVDLSLTELFEMNKERNWAGNCAEFGTWSQVCKAQGEYASLCIRTVKPEGMKFCAACDEIAKAARKRRTYLLKIFGIPLPLLTQMLPLNWQAMVIQLSP